MLSIYNSAQFYKYLYLQPRSVYPDQWVKKVITQQSCMPRLPNKDDVELSSPELFLGQRVIVITMYVPIHKDPQFIASLNLPWAVSWCPCWPR